MFRACVIGVVVWAVVFALREAVHITFHAVVYWVEHAPSLLLVFIPLLLGALAIAAIVHYGHCAQMHYRDDAGHVHELIDVEGDGLERAIAPRLLLTARSSSYWVRIPRLPNWKRPCERLNFSTDFHCHSNPRPARHSAPRSSRLPCK